MASTGLIRKTTHEHKKCAYLITDTILEHYCHIKKPKLGTRCSDWATTWKVMALQFRQGLSTLSSPKTPSSAVGLTHPLVTGCRGSIVGKNGRGM
jgi:hypothetical protein